MIEMTKPAVPVFAKFAERISVPFSPVVRAGDWVYVSGIAPINPETGGYDLLPIDQQARRVLDHLKACLEAAGSGLDRVVKCNVYCSNPAYFAPINAVYTEYFNAYRPARIFLGQAGWFGPFDLEMDCVALVKE